MPGAIEATANPKGIFDRSTLGASLEPITLKAERGRLVFFAETIGETNPIHLDADVARSQGHPDIVALSTFAAVLDQLANKERARRGDAPFLEYINADYSRLLHGEERYDYKGLIFAGDEVICNVTVDAFEDKKGGALELCRSTMTIEHASRGQLVSASRSLIHRLG